MRAMPAVAVAAERSPGFVSSCLSAQNTPYIHPSSWAVRRMSYTFVAGSPYSGIVIGRSQNRKLSTPLGLSATAKKESYIIKRKLMRYVYGIGVREWKE